MAVLSLPSMVSDFEGEIGHVVVAGNETLIFVRLSTWQGEWEKINTKLQSLVPFLKKITSLSAVKSGEVYIVKVKDSFERSYIIRRPAPETYLIYLIDKGMQYEIQFGEIYEFPPELFEFGMFNCVCPVLVPSAEELNTYKTFVGYKCKCIVEAVSKSIVVMGFVRGRLLIEIKGHYEDLYDIIFGKRANRPGGSGIALAKLHLTTDKNPGHLQAGQMDDSSSASSESTFPRPFIQKTGFKINANARLLFPDGNDFATPKKEKHVRMGTGFIVEHDRIKMGTLFNQTAFKQYIPEMLPMKISARFDKTDRMMNTFWVVNKKIFSAAERALREVGNKLSRFPPVSRRSEDIQMRQTPCIARARADTAYKSLYRGVPAQYDSHTKRISVFLVDFGWFKWVLANDVLDISTMDKSDPVRNLPVAMIHCREDTTSTYHANDLIKGADCEIIIKGNASRDVYTVDLLRPPFMSSRFDGTAEINGRETMVDNMRETEMVSSCKKLVTETCQQQLMTSMMMETLSIAGRELAQQPRALWPSFYPTVFPMAMPMMMAVMFPVMWPVPFTNTNLQGIGDSVAVRPQNTGTNDFEGATFSNNNPRGRSGTRVTNNKRSPKMDCMQKSGARFQSSSTQPEREWPRSDSSAKNVFAVVPSDKNKQMPRNSYGEENNGLSWDLPPQYAKQRRTFQRGCDSNAQKDRLTDWEKAVAADRAVRNQQDNNPSGGGV
ncbi:hypothetical protein LOAG_08129 [Loa loa]|nr:hypothetical protein LOAG_08129 [Loa loa]EFO20362.2 hypothetical protein LOAG_08129 [Loa loa]